MSARKRLLSTQLPTMTPENRGIQRVKDLVTEVKSLYDSNWKPAMVLLNAKPAQATAAGFLLANANGKMCSTLHSLQFAVEDLERTMQRQTDSDTELGAFDLDALGVSPLKKSSVQKTPVTNDEITQDNEGTSRPADQQI